MDDDRLFLDQVLNKLYDFGDGAGKKKSKKSKKRKSMSAEEDENNIDESTDAVTNDLLTNVSVCENTSSVSQESNVEVITFIDPTKKRPKNAIKAVEPIQKKNDDKEKTDSDSKLAIEKARFEVHRFGLSGYQKEQQRVFEQDRAIMLGARPPKKQYINYKEYQKMIQEKKEKEKEEAKSGMQKKKRKEGNKRTVKSKSSSGGQLGGQVGRFKDGMLVLSSKDFQKVNVKTKKK